MGITACAGARVLCICPYACRVNIRYDTWVYWEKLNTFSIPASPLHRFLQQWRESRDLWIIFKNKCWGQIEGVFLKQLVISKEGHRHKNTWHPCPKWTLELDKIHALKFSNLFISLSVNTGARTLSPTLVFTFQPADRKGGQVWLSHILFRKILPNTNQSWWKWFNNWSSCSHKLKEKENEARCFAGKITRESIIADATALRGSPGWHMFFSWSQTRGCSG